MVINLPVLDKYESNHTGDGQTYRKTIIDVLTRKIYKSVRSNVVTRGVTKIRTLTTGVIIDTF